jgi:hypothetical protein
MKWWKHAEIMNNFSGLVLCTYRTVWFVNASPLNSTVVSPAMLSTWKKMLQTDSCFTSLGQDMLQNTIGQQGF